MIYRKALSTGLKNVYRKVGPKRCISGRSECYPVHSHSQCIWVLVQPYLWDEMEKEGTCNFMIPIILYTEISQSGKISIHPVQMLLGIFTEKVSQCLLNLEIPKFITNKCLLSGDVVPMHGTPLDMSPMKMNFFAGKEQNKNTPDIKSL